MNGLFCAERENYRPLFGHIFTVLEKISMKISGNPACTCEKKIFLGGFFASPPRSEKKNPRKNPAKEKKKKNRDFFLAGFPTQKIITV